jgi:hypothetical protein
MPFEEAFSIITFTYENSKFWKCQPFEVFTFTSVLLLSSFQQVNKMNLKEKLDDDDPLKFALTSTDPRKAPVSYVCQAASMDNREDWIKNLQFLLQTQKDFLRAIQSPIKYQKNRLTKEV